MINETRNYDSALLDTTVKCVKLSMKINSGGSSWNERARRAVLEENLQWLEADKLRVQTNMAKSIAKTLFQFG